MNVIRGRTRLKNQQSILADEVKAGSLVHVKTATISKVTSGSIVIAETITGLETISSGAIVIACYPSNPSEQNIDITSGGRLYSSIEECVSELKSEKRESSDERAEKVQSKIEMIQHLQMWD